MEIGTTMESHHPASEWVTLQHDHERLEALALMVKLLAVVLCTFGVALDWRAPALLAPLPILWLQEGILRTSQSRLGVRLLRIEAGLAAGRAADAFRLHTEWQATRPGAVGLVVEYLRNALRPTVAFPYVVLLAVALVV